MAWLTKCSWQINNRLVNFKYHIRLSMILIHSFSAYFQQLPFHQASPVHTHTHNIYIYIRQCDQCDEMNMEEMYLIFVETHHPFVLMERIILCWIHPDIQLNVHVNGFVNCSDRLLLFSVNCLYLSMIIFLKNWDNILCICFYHHLNQPS